MSTFEAVDEILQDVRKYGVYIPNGDDEELGTQIMKMRVETEVELLEAQLEFFEANIIDHPVLFPVLKCFRKPCLGGIMSMSSKLTGIYTMTKKRDDNKKPPIVLRLDFWEKNSQVVYWKGSHEASLKLKPSSTPFFEVDPVDLNNVCPESAITECFSNGGFTISHHGTAYQITKGLITGFYISEEEIVSRWAGFKLPAKESYKKIIASIREAGVEVKVEWCPVKNEVPSVQDVVRGDAPLPSK
ncbi:hypothetical protein BD289DRAFT_447815 [Coniella lustricola]|uniref:Uncharacterized protein n=1 Tax=Coniella lustricola TaxID=2025994 RepID=A0A2T2ZSQ2_9PEZI|nr:hypothetical protein BD289DRAFT_447815 [Coniella lustricola]